MYIIILSAYCLVFITCSEKYLNASARVGGFPLGVCLFFFMCVGPARVDWDGKLKSYKTKTHLALI